MDGRRQQMAQLAARQLGLVSAAQIAELGFSKEQRRHLLASRVFTSVRRSVYAMAGTPESWQREALAAVLAVGRDVVLSHGTAARVWRLKHWERAGGGCPDIHVTSSRHLRIKGIRSHERQLAPARRATHRGLPVTSPEQTIVDLAGLLTPAELGECIDDALRRGLVRLHRLHHLVRMLAGPGRRRILPLREALADRGVGYDPGDSDWEQAMQRLWRRLGLPPAVAQYWVNTGARRYRIDLALPELKIGIEWNGFETHGTRSAFDRDSDRRADLTAAGWHMLDFTSRSSPQRIGEAIQAAIRGRRQLAA